MADFDSRPLLVTETASVWDVACPGACKHRSDEEYVAATHLVFPYRGVYVHHVGRAETVAEANQAVILNENEPYRVSHPFGVVMPAFRSPPVLRFCSSWRLNTIS